MLRENPASIAAHFQKFIIERIFWYQFHPQVSKSGGRSRKLKIMAGRNFTLSLWTIIVFISAASSIAVNGSSHSLLSENDPLSLYFATAGGVKRCSLDNNEVKTVGDSTNGAYGVVFDWLRDKIYWSDSSYKVFRAQRDGTEVEVCFNTDKCKSKFPSFVFEIV